MRITAEMNLNLNVQTNDAEQSLNGLNTLKNLLPHQIVSGEVVDVREGYAKVAIGEDAFFWAQTGGLSVSKGQSMVLELISNGNNQISLRPLYQNLNHDQNLMKALDAAELPATERNLTMTALRMESGMPIDRHSLLDASRDLMRFPEADVRDIHMLHSLKMDVNEVNLSLIENLRANESMIQSRTEAISEDLAKSFLALNEKDAADAGKEVAVPSDSLGNAEDASVQTPNQNTTMQSETSLSKEQQISADTMPPKGEVITEPEEQIAITNGQKTEESDGLLPKDTENNEMTLKDGQITLENGRESLQIGKEAETYLRENLSALGLSEAEIEGTVTSVRHMKPETAEAELKDMFQSVLKDAWSFESESLTDKNAIANYYDKVYEQAKAVHNNLEKASSMLTKTEGLSYGQKAGEIADSLQFLHQMNEVMSFVEIPLKMAGAENGELYVMARKNGSNESDEQTAYIRLTMEHLGLVECGISLNSEKLVKTNFVLQDDETLAFVEEHMPMLDERLKERGYTTSIHIRKKEDAEDMDILGSIASCLSVSPKRISVKETYGFDVRA